MSVKNAKLLTRDQIVIAISNSKTMGAAAKNLNVDWRTFKKEAEKYDLYHPAKQSTKKFHLEDIIFNDLHPQYPTSKLLPRLVKEGYKLYACESCGISEYNDKHISLEVNHIDGNNGNHHLSNLQVLCPNCHSQTDTYRSKKLKYSKLAES
jgi:5-methylcytosine-specific restriction endonuclease McrA